MDRRTFLETALSGAVVATTSSRAFAGGIRAGRRFTLCLTPGSIGVRAAQEEMISTAADFGFESVEPVGGYLASLDGAGRASILKQLETAGLVWGAAGLPVQFRQDEAAFREGMERLPSIARALQDVGVTRVGTYIMPRHDTLTYRKNFSLHRSRLSDVADVLAECGLRLGLEYVGPKTSWTAQYHSFIHCMEEMKELIAAIDRQNVGFVLDSWHWYTAKETVDDLLTLTNDDIVSCDLNDAPEGIPIDEQQDLSRELPCATGVIDVKAFLEALVRIGYDGPIRAEPFNEALNAMDDRAAVRATAKAMKQAVALLDT